jgi:hypothetical protein
MDALWSTSYEHQKPQKFWSSPFNNDWCSSLLFSLDPVAIESVGLDILQKEFRVERLYHINILLILECQQQKYDGMNHGETPGGPRIRRGASKSW